MTHRNAQKSPQTKAADIDVESMAAIRSLLHAEPPEQVTPDETPKRPRRLSPVSNRKAQSAPDPDAAVETPVEKPSKANTADRRKKSASKDTQAGLVMRILGHDYSLKAVLAVGTVLILYFRPWLILGLVFLAMLMVASIFLIMGYDGFWRRTMAAGRWYAQRHPARAVELHRKLDGFAMKWDAILDRFPEGTVDGLYLPDFGAVAEADVKHDAAMDRRFSQMRES